MRLGYALVLSGLLIAGPTAGQPAHSGASTHGPPGKAAEPMGSFQVRAYGAFRLFMQKQDYSPKVSLGEAKAMGLTDGVGAVSGLRGEISLIDGLAIVSYGGGCKGQCPLPHLETAALLGTGQVRNWHAPIRFPERMAGKSLEEFISTQARAKGIDLDKPFPLRLKGMLVDVAMHVIEAPNDGFTGHGSKVHMARQDEFSHAQIAGDVVGIYAPSTMHGVLTHPGELFHFHWIDVARTRTAHLDAFGMEKGAELLLPKD
ncbi:acetolactate decarboxylase [Rhabdaerophilum sp. SD176]|uniref:acetolactate decarboxylase n=1 Tax=Rhabdaerophilum sp. SD176 TaxID=2983548 RepID=UPI0024DF93B0|nr:acetolactate decarboxylase [Rhabdaerophilum sp. SD176]